MEKILIFIKHRLTILWRIIEWGNAMIFSMFFKSKTLKLLPGVIEEFSSIPYSYRRLDLTDAEDLFHLINSQKTEDLKYFSPHGFDLLSIKKQFSNTAFLMMGAFLNEKLVGYFFLRFFANKKSFVGRLIDAGSRGKGIGNDMNNIMYETSWRIGFRCLSTISRNNKAVMRAHAKNRRMHVLKDLNDDFVLVEFLQINEN